MNQEINDEKLETADIKQNNETSEQNSDESLQNEEVQKEQDKMLALKEEISDLTDQLVRQVAETENIRKRYEKMLEESKNYAISNFAKDMLAVMDNLSRALSHKPQEMTQEMHNIITGVEMTKQEMINIFNKYKMSSISPSIGDKFDYNIHNAVSQIVTNEHPEGTILHVMQDGYILDGRLLRPAMVTVTKT